MMKKIYYWFHEKMSDPGERGEYSAGRWQDMVRKEALRLCRNDKGKLLEAGCGEGLFLVKLASLNKKLDIYGIDNRPEILEKAEKKIEDNNCRNIKVIKADAASMPFEDSYFDTVVCINVIFNLPSEDLLKKVLKEISRVCKKDAAFILDFRNKKNPFLYLKYKLAPFYDETVKNLPLKTYTLREMSQFAEEAGFTVECKKMIGPKISLLAPIIILNLRKKS
ncbi:MAG: class I SAM-dependent methyltransferase [bacterium]